MSSGCNSAPQELHLKHDSTFLVSTETLRAELSNPKYEWLGPTSVEERIPILHAARALAYRGDSAAVVLFDAVDDPEIEIFSVLDAISELGIPAHEFHDEIMSRNTDRLREWWEANRASTLDQRNGHRKRIGLPPAQIGR